MYVLYRLYRHLGVNSLEVLRVVLVYQILFGFLWGKMEWYGVSCLDITLDMESQSEAKVPIDVGVKLSKNRPLSPVILVPGDGGCQVEAKWSKNKTVSFFCTKKQLGWTTIWLILSDFAPYSVNCFVDNMKLVYNNRTRTTQNSPGVEIRIPGFGNTASIEYLDPSYLTRFFLGYFNTIVQGLVKLGYVRGKSIRGAPFDFRKAPNELHDYYVNLTKLIESSYEAQNKRKVTIMAHSMGAPVLHFFFTRKSQKWKDKYIQAVISLAGAWGGSIKPIKVYAVGDDLGYRLISSSKIKPLQVSFSSLAFLMPSREVWDSKEVLVQTPKTNYSLSNIEGYFKALSNPNGYEMYKDTKSLLYKAPAPGVELHCLHGLGLPTVERLVYKNQKDFPSNPQLVNGDGDGTVNTRSAQSCLRFRGKQKQEVYYRTYKKVDHMNILSNAKVLNYIIKYVKEVNSEHNNFRTRALGDKALGLGQRVKMYNATQVESNRIL